MMNGKIFQSNSRRPSRVYLTCMSQVMIFPGADELAQAAAGEFARLAARAVLERGRFCVLLAGGSTPLSAYRLLAGGAFDELDWSRVQFCFGDERCVPPDHADSNFRQVQEALLASVAAEAGQVHRMPGELVPEQGAAAYESELRKLFPGQTWPRFDLVLLGLGEDGHTASLFPGSPVLEERRAWVVCAAHTSPPPPMVTRLTVTFPVINHARWILLLVSGANKAQALAQALQPEPGAGSLPVQSVAPLYGEVTWLVDRAAAAGLAG